VSRIVDALTIRVRAIMSGVSTAAIGRQRRWRARVSVSAWSRRCRHPGWATERSVTIRPIATAAGVDGRRQGWTRPDRDRTFKLEHRDYGAGPISGFEYDIGAVLVQVTTATGEVQPTAALEVWNLQPKQFLHPRQTDDPT
jgi:hypothetical protein